MDDQQERKRAAYKEFFEAFIASTGYPPTEFEVWCAAPAAPTPLTLQYIEQHIGPDEGDRDAVLEIVRQVERAHGIGAASKGGDKP